MKLFPEEKKETRKKGKKIEGKLQNKQYSLTSYSTLHTKDNRSLS